MAHARATSRPAPHGRVVGRYLMYGQIGSGGTATVHIGRLRGQGGFARTVALKRLHAHLARDPYFASLFLSEARLGARISHPNVASLLDVVRLGDGELLLVMDYVHGETLAGLLSLCRRREDPIPPRIAVAITIGALLGLHAAHEALGEDGRPLGLVHGDVSPHNVIVGADGTTRMLDFGVARAGVASGADCRVIGTLAYMAPERLNGASFDRRSDVFSAGVLLWEMLAMRRLFAGADGRGKRGLAQILAPSKFRPGLSADVDAVVMQALHTEPDRRAQTALLLARALERALPPATNQEVADWLNQTAGARLRERADELSRIERSSAPTFLPGEDPDDQPTTALETPAAPPSRAPARPAPAAPAVQAEDDPTLFDINCAFREEPATARPVVITPPRQRRTLTPRLSQLPELSPSAESGSDEDTTPTPSRPRRHRESSSLDRSLTPELSPSPPPVQPSEYPITATRPRGPARWMLMAPACLVLCSVGAWNLGRSSVSVTATAARATDLARVTVPAPAAMAVALATAPPEPRPAPVPEPVSASVLTPATVPAPASAAMTAPAPVAAPVTSDATFDATFEAASESIPAELAAKPAARSSETDDRAVPSDAALRTSIPERVEALNQRALAAYGRLDPARALRLLGAALRLGQRAGRSEIALTARTQINLGVVLAGGFKQRGLAARHFRLARALDPAIMPTRALSNPEIEAALREAGAYSPNGF
jgi:serine/threonine protein kinase